MAKNAAPAKGPNVQGYFRVIFKENPKLLKERSNRTLYERWLKDHPGEKEVSIRVRQSLSNIKSVLRNRKKTRRKMSEQQSAATNRSVAVTSPARIAAGLVRLEGQIDEALVLARQLDLKGLSDVIGILRSARNRVVIRLG